jgi:hypothetical protein
MKIFCILIFGFFATVSFGYSQSLELKILKFDIHDCSSLDSMQSNQDSLYEYEKKCNHFYIEWPTIYGESDWVNSRIEQKLQHYICGLIQSDQIDTVEYTSKLTDEFVLKHNRDASAEWDISCEYCGSFKNVHQFSVSHGGYYFGAAHGFGYTQYFHLNSITGNEIHLQNLFNEKDLEKLSSFSLNKMIKEQEEIWVDDVKNAFFLSENFLLEVKGMTFYYNAYEIGPYAMGYPEISITWEEIQSCLGR